VSSPSLVSPRGPGVSHLSALRDRRGVLLTLLLCSWLVALSGCLSKREPADAHLDPTYIRRDVPYGPLAEQIADIYLAKTQKPAPAVVLVHGGSWARGNRQRIQRVAVRAVERGYVAINIEYRLGPEHPYPQPEQDVLAAICWVRSQADSLGIDPRRIAVWGYSAGAQMGLVAAAEPGLAASLPDCSPAQAVVQACVAGAPPTDLRRFGDAGPVVDHLGGSQEEVPAAYEAASPVLLVSRAMPPVFLYHGESDWIVDVDHSRKLRDRLVALEIPVELVETEHGHFSQNLYGDAALTRGFDFLDRWMKE